MQDARMGIVYVGRGGVKEEEGTVEKGFSDYRKPSSPGAVSQVLSDFNSERE